MALKDLQVLVARVSFTFKCETHSGGYPIYPGVMICPVCLRQWASIKWADFIPGQYQEVRGFMCYSCALAHPEHLHPDLRPVGGSLLDNPTVNGVNYALLDAMPEVLLRREFVLHLEFYK